MTDIKQAVQELYEALDVLFLLENDDHPVTEWQSKKIAQISAKCSNAIKGLTAFALSVEGGTVDFTSRIEAAADEIAKEIKCAYGIATDERDVSDIAAIIKRHIEGGK